MFYDVCFLFACRKTRLVKYQWRTHARTHTLFMYGDVSQLCIVFYENSILNISKKEFSHANDILREGRDINLKETSIFWKPGKSEFGFEILQQILKWAIRNRTLIISFWWKYVVSECFLVFVLF